MTDAWENITTLDISYSHVLVCMIKQRLDLEFTH